MKLTGLGEKPKMTLAFLVRVTGMNSKPFTVTGNWKRDKFREDDRDIWFSPCPL